MSVILNEAAITALLNAPEGPVARFVEREANKVVEAAQRNVRDYFSSAAALTVDRDVGLDMEGSTATVGIRDAGSKSRRLAARQADGRVNWLVKALEEARTL